jgi:hypothetical protein
MYMETKIVIDTYLYINIKNDFIFLLKYLKNVLYEIKRMD